jgi:23S rRNA pseudouridine2605 synthase
MINRESADIKKRDKKSNSGRSKKPDNMIRLNRYIAHSGICSRREADELIRAGFITVNGKKVKDLGTVISAGDDVRYRNRRLKPEKMVYIILNKPRGYVTTVDDPHAEKSVLDLIEGACQERVYPVGRLDKDTTGVLLLTNDGELTGRLTHPRYNRKKVYHVVLDRPVSKNDLLDLTNGIEIDGKTIEPDAISYTDPEDKTQVGIEIHSGQNRIVRRIFEKLGYKIKRLDRVYFAGLTKKNLPRGKWRFLKGNEISMLKRGIF